MELWKDIPNYEGFYQASDLGRIRSLDHVRKNGTKLINEIKVLEQQCKKQKEIFNKATEYIKERFYFNEETGEYSLLHTFDKDNIKELLDILKGEQNEK